MVKKVMNQLHGQSLTGPIAVLLLTRLQSIQDRIYI